MSAASVAFDFHSFSLACWSQDVEASVGLHYMELAVFGVIVDQFQPGCAFGYTGWS